MHFGGIHRIGYILVVCQLFSTGRIHSLNSLNWVGGSRCPSCDKQVSSEGTDTCPPTQGNLMSSEFHTCSNDGFAMHKMPQV